MKVINTGLIDFLKKAGCFEIPCYQRAYTWKEKQWKQLFDDILSLSRYENMKKHFLGTIVYETSNVMQISKTNCVKLIDGQQRLITVSVLLVALKNIASNTKNSKLSDLIEKNLLTNEDDDQRFKIILKEEDKEVYENLVNGKESSSEKNAIFAAYEFFKNQIEEASIDAEKLFETMSKLEIVDMALESDIDNAQLIFDSLNSTGISLNETEQIKNFVLLGADEKEQLHIFNHFWKPMELAFENADSTASFEDFIRDYLTIQNNGAIPKVGCLYEEFNKFYMNKLKFQTRETIIKHLMKYSKYYIKMLCSNLRDKDAREHIQAINDINAKDAYPFLMEVLEDYESELIDREILLEILSTVEHFVTNRDKLAHPEKTFVTLSNDINQMLALKNFTPKIVQNRNKMTINDLLEESDENISA